MKTLKEQLMILKRKYPEDKCYISYLIYLLENKSQQENFVTSYINKHIKDL